MLYALKCGEIYATSDLKGFASWLTHQNAVMKTIDMFKCHFIANFRKAKGIKLKRIMNLEDFNAGKHKKYADFPHWYLHNLAVEPEYQRRGYASLLLVDMLSKIDKDNLPCYVETQNKKNVSMYRKFGFEVLEETFVPGTEYEYYFMLRPKKL